MTTVKEAQAGPQMRAAGGKKKRAGVLLTGATWIISVLFVFPVVWMIWTSFHSETDAASNPPKVLSSFSVQGYKSFFGSDPWPTILNSLTASVVSTLLVLCLALPAAYALSIRPVKRWSDVLFFFLSTKFMPVVAALLPVYLFAEKVHFLDNIWLLVILYTSMNLPIAVWMLRSFLAEIPAEMLEAAQVDGAGLLRTLREIIAPVIMPGIASAALICFIFSWNELLFARVLTGTRAETAPVFLTGFVTSQGLFLAQVCAASFVVSLPVLAAGFAAQDKLVQGLSMGAVR
ncbi:mannitol ABC transporter permease [Flexivirga endophytica]|uniref:Mannitol ABC transporter permease n=2 Tax=Flexivirga endophytica TaxID=1849103 RepID=A0A916WXS7_9MICO|nr:mannitol ABC transporter permease [Flexivirga endophytica]GHB70387.1 mannitol ABC transporter permease [Flexivirga endophytica]